MATQHTSPRERVPPLTLAVLGAGLGAVALYFVLPVRMQLVWYVAIEAVAAGVAMWCALRMPRSRRRGALFVAAGLAAFALADAVFNGAQLVDGHATTFPSVADGIFLLGYPLITLGAASFVTRTGTRFSSAAGLETAIVIVVAASLQWVLIGPDVATALGSIILFAYTVGDALLIALVVRGLVDRAGRRLSHVLFLVGAILLLVADVIYAVNVDSYGIGSWYDSLWLVSAVMIAAAITAAAAESVPEPPPEAARHSPASVLVILGVALLVTPGAFIWFATRHQLADSSALLLAGASIALTALVFARIAMLMRTMSATQAREHIVRRAAESEHARLASLMSQMQSGVLVEDAQRRIALVNVEFCRIFGMPEEPDLLLGADCTGAADQSKHLATDPEAFVALIDARMAAREIARSDIVTFADGRVFERDFVPITIGTEHGGTLWQYRDVTERRRAAEQLAEARDQAVRAAEIKSEFLATMSHEIRTPMYGVIGTLDLLRRTELDAGQRDLVRVMDDSARGLVEIINSVLDFSKVDAGKVELHLETLSLRAIVESVADLLGPEARRKGLRLATDVAPEVPGALRGDPGRVRQVLVNLVGNAIKFTDDGDVAVTVRRDGEDQHGSVVSIEVVDTGAGIPADRIEQIFLPFMQVDAGRARAHAGTGLGLAITQGLVQAMNGTVECASDVGRGTTLTVRIPFESVTADLEADADRPLSGRGVGLRLRPGPAVESLARALVGLGADVRRAGTRELLDSDITLVDNRLDLASGPVLVVSAGDDPARLEPGPRVLLPVHAARLAKLILAELGAAPQTAVAVGTDVRTVGHTESLPTRERQLPRVLLVDDNDVNRSLAQRQLEQLGVACHAVSSGTSAIDALRGQRYALVLMDCRMPEMDGFEATRRIRADETELGEHTPVVALTADGRPEDRRACIAAGMDDHLAKPFRMDDLERVLERWVRPPAVTEPVPSGAPAEAVGIGVLLDEIGEEAALRLFASWKAETPRRLEAMRDGLDRHDAGAVADAAHVLKSTCGLFGAVRAAETAARAEDVARRGDVVELPDLYDRLEVEISQAILALDAQLTA